MKRTLFLSAIAVFAVTPSAVARKPTVSVTALYAGAHAGDRVGVHGIVRGARHADRIVLERLIGSRWIAVARAPIRHERLVVRWRIPAGTGRTIWLRAVAREDGRTLARSARLADAVAPPPTPCAAPSPPGDVPAGDGWITGGAYFEGGPAPGLGPNCLTQDYTVTVANADGVVIASEHVAGGHSYTLVVPAGSYTLRADAARGTAVVTAGHETKANAYILAP